MRKSTRIINPILIISGVLILISIVFPAPVAAQGIVRGDDLPAGVTLAGDAIFHGNSVRIDGDVDGDVFAIANEVEVNGKISGSLIVIGNMVSMTSNVKGTVYAAAVQFELKPEAVLKRNLYFGGLSLNTQKGSQIYRDLYSVTMGAQLRGQVEGEIRAIIGPAEIFFQIMRKIDQTDWLNSKKTSLEEILNPDYKPGTAVNGSGIEYASLAPVLTRETISTQQAGGTDWKLVGDWLLKRLQECIVLLVFGLLGLWLTPKWIHGSAQVLQSRLLSATGWGLLGVVIAFNLAGVVVLLLITSISIFLFLGMVTFWQLAWSFFATSGFGLGLVSTIFALFVFYVSKAIVAFFVGTLILKKIAPAYAGYNPLTLIIGLVLYVLLAAIPILGWVIGLLATALGLGAAWLFYKEHRALQRNLSIQ